MTDADTCLAARPIPPATAGPITEEHLPVLLWVHVGTATVDAGSISHRLRAGQAIWIPPGVRHCTRADAGGVVLPIFPRLPELRGPLAEVRVISAPRGWEDWFVSQFDLNRYHTRGARPDERTLLGLVVDGTPRDARPGGDSGAPALPMPHSREAQAVAHAVLRSPAAEHRITELAAHENVSVRTLQRQFHHETGMTFSEWRARARVTVAAGHLLDGRTVSWVGRAVGYDTPAGFTRAFHRYFGCGPAAFARRASTVADRPTGPDEHATTHLAALVADTPPPPPPPIPARQPWSWVFGAHVLWWVYRGMVEIQIGAHRFALRRGQAIWLPAGITASVDDIARGSILLPLGDRRGGPPIGVDELRPFSFPPEADAYLLHTVLAEYTLFGTTGERPRLADELLREQLVFGRDRATGEGLTGVVATIATALCRDPADSRSLAQWAAHLRLPPEQVGTEFRSQTGSSFPRWRAHLRMSLARQLLAFDDPPREVSKLLGYATPAAFGKVFAVAHGVSPRTYQQRVSRRLANARSAAGSDTAGSDMAGSDMAGSDTGGSDTAG